MERTIGGKTAQDLFGQTPQAQLAKAACAGDVAGIQEALSAGAQPNARGKEEATALLWALGCDNVVGMEALLKAGADPNLPVGPTTPVVIAATRHDPKPLAMLLKYGGDANAKNTKKNETAMAEALSLGIHGFGWANYYALINKADINRADELGYTIATDAAALNQYDKVAELLERGYTYDLEGLGRFVQISQVDLEPLKSAHQKVKHMLEARGVRFPIPPKRPPASTPSSID